MFWKDLEKHFKQKDQLKKVFISVVIVKFECLFYVYVNLVSTVHATWNYPNYGISFHYYTGDYAMCYSRGGQCLTQGKIWPGASLVQ